MAHPTATLTDDQLRTARSAAEAFLSSYAAYTLVGRDQDLHHRLNRWGRFATAYGIPQGEPGWAGRAEAAARFLMRTDRTR